jgi:flagellar basal body P-ring formation protein FlgA
MNISSVKTSTPAPRVMQILCLPIIWLFLTGLMAAAHAQTAASSDGLSKMHLQVKQWLAQTHSVSPADVSIAPLDERLKVQLCDKPLQVDHPFASKQTVRVRCSEPNWQLFVQVSLPATSPSPAPGTVNASSVLPGSSNASPSSPAGSNAGTPQQKPTRTTLITKRLLQRGTLLQADMLEEAQVQAANVDTQLLTSFKDVQQAELTRDIPAGQPLRISDIRRALMVRQGQVVMLSVGEKNEFQISIRMEAMQDGRMGEQVKLRNPESGKQVSGVVTGPNAARGL